MKPSWIPFGFLPVFKPVGPTSHDIVDQVRKLLPRKVKVGHTGTLDPFASGVLILALGKATRFADEVHRLSKSYEAAIHLGLRTNTLDPTGEMDLEMPVPEVTVAMLEDVCQRFIGTQLQVPPAFSAKRVKGRKSYELARENKAVELEPREITLHELILKQKDDVTLLCHTVCSTGTYIRSLGRDIGEALGTCAHLVALERSGVGPVKVDECLRLEGLDPTTLYKYLIPVSKLLPQFPEIQLPDVAYNMLIQGRPFKTDEQVPATFLGVYRDSSGIRAIFRCIYDANVSSILSKQLCYLDEKPRVKEKP